MCSHRASSLAAVAEGIYAHQKWIIKQFFPDTADTDFLEKHAGLRGIRRRNATYASGRGAIVTGTPDTVIKAGLQIKTDDNRFYETTESAVISASGSAGMLSNQGLLPFRPELDAGVCGGRINRL